jgi:hypothetical protein
MASGGDEFEAFDAEGFSAIDFVNRLFPNGACACAAGGPTLGPWRVCVKRPLTRTPARAEPALAGVDPLIQKLKLKIRRIDDDILTSVRAQSTSGSQAKADLEAAMTAIKVRAREGHACVRRG